MIIIQYWYMLTTVIVWLIFLHFKVQKDHHAGSGKTSRCIYSICPSISDCLSVLIPDSPERMLKRGDNAGFQAFVFWTISTHPVKQTPIKNSQVTIDKAMKRHSFMLCCICLVYFAQLWTIMLWSLAPQRHDGNSQLSTCRTRIVWHFQRPESNGPGPRAQRRFNKQSWRKFPTWFHFNNHDFMPFFMSWISGHCYWPHLRLSVWENLGCGSKWWILQSLSPPIWVPLPDFRKIILDIIFP